MIVSASVKLIKRLGTDRVKNERPFTPHPPLEGRRPPNQKRPAENQVLATFPLIFDA